MGHHLHVKLSDQPTSSTARPQSPTEGLDYPYHRINKARLQAEAHRR